MLLSVKDLTIGYDGNAILSGISFDVDMGDRLYIIGENGAGKSTLLNAILGLKKPLGGEIVFAADIRRNQIGYLPQQTDIQKDFPASVREIVLSGCLSKMGLRPFYNKTEKLLAQKNMAALGIENLAQSCYRELSGGQQQRVLLARALCSAEKAIFLDEPVSGLDPHAAESLYRAVEKLNAETNAAVVMVSHDLAAAAKYATHILHIGKSEYFFGTAADYAARTGADVPFMQGGAI